VRPRTRDNVAKHRKKGAVLPRLQVIVSPVGRRSHGHGYGAGVQMLLLARARAGRPSVDDTGGGGGGGRARPMWHPGHAMWRRRLHTSRPWGRCAQDQALQPVLASCHQQGSALPGCRRAATACGGAAHHQPPGARHELRRGEQSVQQRLALAQKILGGQLALQAKLVDQHLRGWRARCAGCGSVLSAADPPTHSPTHLSSVQRLLAHHLALQVPGELLVVPCTYLLLGDGVEGLCTHRRLGSRSVRVCNAITPLQEKLADLAAAILGEG